MFLPIKVQIEVGEFVEGWSYPYRTGSDVQIDSVKGFVSKVDRKKKRVWVDTYDRTHLKIHRISSFSFGSIIMLNDEFDQERMWSENQKMMRKLRV